MAILSVSDVLLFFTLLINAIAIARPLKSFLGRSSSSSLPSSLPNASQASKSSNISTNEPLDESHIEQILRAKVSESMKELDGNERNMRVDLSTDKRDIIRIGIDDENDDNDDDEFLSVTGIQAPLLKNRSLTNITLSNDTSSRASNAVLERACSIVMHVRRCGVLIAMWNVLFMLAMLLIIP